MRAAFFAATFLLFAINAAAAIGKLLDMPGFVGVVGTYRLLPDVLLWPAAIVITAGEAAIAAGLALPRYRRPAAYGAAAMAVGYALGLLITLARGIPLENCGCFGVYFPRPLTIWSPLEDVALLALALFVAAKARPQPR